MSKQFRLYNVQGISRLSGEDEDGNKYIQYVMEEPNLCVDPSCSSCDPENPNGFSGHGDFCSICDEEIFEGWTCLDGGEVFCYDHIIYKPTTRTEIFNSEFGYVMESMKELEIDKILWTLLNVKNVYTEKEELYEYPTRIS